MKKIIMSLILFLCVFACPALAGVWDIELPHPDYDPLWSKVTDLWENHWDGKNIDEIITALHELEKKYPDKVETYLWLGRAYYLKGQWKKKDRLDNYKKSEMYALKAHTIDETNITALKILVDTLPNYADKQYLMTHYGEWVKKVTPLPIGRALPELEPSDEWIKAMKNWDQRGDIEKGKAAVEIFKQIADKNPANGLAQIWASRSLYYLGEYHTSIGQHKTKAVPYYKEGMTYGERALKILPYSIPAHYWLELNLARSVQYTSLFNKARHFKPLLDHILFCSRENGLYYYCGPTLTLATMITNGGWVTEKGMRLTGHTLEMEMNSLDIAEILYPNYFYIPYGKADILAYLGRKQEAREVLDRLFARDPDANKFNAPDNRCTLRLAKELLDEIE
ncbi:MAG: hypothetical protein J7L53_03710 [Deltaproteobacteria bacterium]|nr:hypothetical protein [Deltaproteobacteria bacterium]